MSTLRCSLVPGACGRGRRTRRSWTELAALVARYRSAEIDASYAAYDEQPLDESDDWGDLASFRRAASSVVSALPARGGVVV